MLAVSGQPIPIDVTLVTGLMWVALKVRDVSAGYPGTSIGSPIPMTEYDVGAYGASFVGESGKAYAFTTASYTDDTYATRDDTQPSGSGTVQVEATSSGGAFQYVVGFVDSTSILGTINKVTVTGTVED